MQYSCPMHPEETSNDPKDTCNKCGMMLEPLEKDHTTNGSCAHCDTQSEKLVLGKRLKQVGLIFILVFAASFHPALTALNQSLISYTQLMWWAVLLGLVIGGIVDHFVPDETIYRYMGGSKKRSIIYAIFAGFLLSACSHGILAIAIQLYKKGASIPAVISFLLASPWANLPVTILLFGFFGFKALIFIFVAMFIAAVTGYLFILFEKLGVTEKSKKIRSKTTHTKHKHKVTLKQHAHGIIKGTINLSNMVLWWILIGFLLSALIKAYVPHHIFMQFFGPSFSGLLLTLLAATIIEVCSEGSAPIAFEIFNQVGKLGNPFVFLMAGVVTDYTEIGLIWSNIGKRTAILLPIITIPQVLFFGFLFNAYL